MVQGTSTSANRSESAAPATSVLRQRSRHLIIAHPSRVTPTDAANNPASGRISTASPQMNPVMTHQRMIDFVLLVPVFDSLAAARENVSVSAIVVIPQSATSKNIVSTS